MAASIFQEQTQDGTSLRVVVQSPCEKEQSSFPVSAEDSGPSSNGYKYSIDLNLLELCKNCLVILENPALAASYYCSPILHLCTLELKDYGKLGKSDLVTTFVFFSETPQPQVQFKVITQISRVQFQAVRELMLK